MKQYLDLLQTIKDKGVHKPAARENMPGTTSRFGHQFRCDLREGFPILTTKKVSFKNIVVELLWFLKGDTNIKFLVDNGCNIWNEDAYNYYCKLAEKNTDSSWNSIYKKVGKMIQDDDTEFLSMLNFEEFVNIIKTNTKDQLQDRYSCNGYTLGDCGYQYGKVWRDWTNNEPTLYPHTEPNIDQIKTVIKSLKKTPDSRRHIITAVDPAHDSDLALYWCHAMFQFNCRPLTLEQKIHWVMKNRDIELENLAITEEALSNRTPQYFLDCQLYQRSADSFLGVPYNIASYALLTEIIARICDMIPGEFVHTFGDVHIYDNHQDAVKEQLSREPKDLPKLLMRDDFHYLCDLFNEKDSDITVDKFMDELVLGMFKLNGYDPHPAIKAELSTGMKKIK
jgi:thymidylate synthase